MQRKRKFRRFYVDSKERKSFRVLCHETVFEPIVIDFEVELKPAVAECNFVRLVLNSGTAEFPEFML